ncbi:MAG: hypothetical protein ABH858_00140 [Candidatus Omnitrophota bacterium]
MELTICMLILLILVIITVPLFQKAKDNSSETGAKSILSLIVQPEEMNRLKTGIYAACAVTFDRNSSLHFELPVDGGWSYSVAPYSSGSEFCAAAVNSADRRKFIINDCLDAAGTFPSGCSEPSEC